MSKDYLVMNHTKRLYRMVSGDGMSLRDLMDIMMDEWFNDEISVYRDDFRVIPSVDFPSYKEF